MNHPSSLIRHANAPGSELLADLTPESQTVKFTSTVPVLATPAAAAAGVTVGVAAFGAGFGVEEAVDG